MADRETLLAINAQLVSKLTAGTATDDDIKTLTAVMGLLEKEASKGSISSSVPQTAPSGRCGAGASAAATSVKILQKRKKNGRKGSGSRQPRGTRIVSADRALEARKDAEAAERVAAADRAMAAREEDEKKAKEKATKTSHGGFSYSRGYGGGDVGYGSRITSADPALEARKDAAAAVVRKALAGALVSMMKAGDVDAARAEAVARAALVSEAAASAAAAKAEGKGAAAAPQAAKAATIKKAESVAAAERAMAAREEDEKKTKATTWASYSGGGSGRSYDSSYSSYSPRAATSMAEAAKVDAIIEKLKSAADSEPRRHVGPFGHPTDRWQPFSHDSFELLRTP